MIGFQLGRVFSYDIYYVSATGGQPTKITQEGNLLAGFAWLPDSSGVVYATSRGDTVLYLPTMNLWSVRIGGKDLRQLTFGETSYASPDVDRSGNLVASNPVCGVGLWNPNSCSGPLRLSHVDSAGTPGNFIPIMGDGTAGTSTLSQAVGDVPAASVLVGGVHGDLEAGVAHRLH